MPSRLTAKFKAWRKAPKKLAPALPEPKGIYPLTGFLSNDETRRERMERLAQAKADGYELAENDWLYMRIANTKLGKGLPTYFAARTRRAEDAALSRAFGGTQPVMRG